MTGEDPLVTATICFVRGEPPLDFGRTNRASTDALNALERWKAERPGRDYEVVADGDAQLEARISARRSDTDAGGRLDDFCRGAGVKRLV